MNYEDFLIYNAMNKEMAGGNTYFLSTDISYTPSTEYQTIVEFVPNLNGKMNVTFDTEHWSSDGHGGDTAKLDLAMYDDSGTAVYEGKNALIGVLSYKAFTKYTIKIKIPDLSAGLVYSIPKKCTLRWDVKDTSGIAVLTSPTA